MPEKIDSIEKAKRIRIIMEWILEEWPSADIISQIVAKWNLSERQAKRYLADARDKWNDDEDVLIERKRKTKIETLKKLKRSLKEQYRGTPLGIRSILAVEKEIISLENLRHAQKVELTGKNGQPIETKTKVIRDEIDYTLLPDDVLLAILKARKVKNARDEDSDD